MVSGVVVNYQSVLRGLGIESIFVEQLAFSFLFSGTPERKITLYCEENLQQMLWKGEGKDKKEASVLQITGTTTALRVDKYFSWQVQGTSA